MDLQEGKLRWWTSIAGITHTLPSVSTPSLMSRATVPSSLANSRRPRSGQTLRKIHPVRVQRRERKKYGQRVAGITVQSLSGAEFATPTLTECNTIPHGKEFPAPKGHSARNTPPPKKKTRQLRSTSYFVEMHGAFKSQGVQKWPERSPPGLGDWSSAGPSVVRCALPSPVVLHTSSLTSPACPLLRRKHRRLGEEFTS